MFIRVVLPAPFSPRRAWISPCLRSRSMRSLATTPGQRLVMPLISSFGGVDGGSGAAGAASEVIQENCTHLPDACEPPPPLPWKRLLVHMLELPGHHVRDVDGEGAKLDDRHHVRPERVADHHELFGLDAAPLEHSAIGVRVLLAEDLDAEKPLAQPRPVELALLVKKGTTPTGGRVSLPTT